MSFGGLTMTTSGGAAASFGPAPVYSTFAIILDHFSRHFQLYATPHAPWCRLYNPRMLIGC